MKHFSLFAALTASLFFACQALANPLTDPTRLEKEDVERIIAQAASRSKELGQESVIAVTDREGYVLALWSVGNSKANRMDIKAGAVARAGTAAFLSSNQNAFTTRTAGYIIQQHFPPMIRNTPPGPLVGVGLSSIGGYSDVNFMKQIPLVANLAPVPPGTFNPNSRQRDFGSNSSGFFKPNLAGAGAPMSPGTFGIPVVGSSLNDPAGGVPLYKENNLVGGIGVVGDHDPIDISTGFAIFEGKTKRDSTPGFKFGPDIDEDIALAGQKGFEPSDEIRATNVTINGIRIPYVETETHPREVREFGTVGTPVTGFPVQAAPPPFDYPVIELGGVKGQIRFPIRDDPFIAAGRPKIGKARRLTAENVEEILTLAAHRASHTRAGIRLPIGTSVKVFVSVVANPAKKDVPPPILGVFRVGEATIFSWDVSVQKARTALFFSNNEFAQSSRTVGFLAQRFYPPGLDGRAPGPYFGFQEALTLNVLKSALKEGRLRFNRNLPNGITIFPGGFPLYRSGKLIGAVGISGDGVDQDDLIGISGSAPFAPPKGIRADQYTYRGARLPYVKFPRDPEK